MEWDAAAFAHRLVERREALGWTRYRLAQETGLSQPYVRELEQGRASDRLGADVLVRLARSLGVSVDDLLRDAGVDLGSVPNVPASVGQIYEDLDVAERWFWLHMGRSLREMRDHASPFLPEEPLAAYEGTDLDRIRRQEPDE